MNKRKCEECGKTHEEGKCPELKPLVKEAVKYMNKKTMTVRVKYKGDKILKKNIGKLKKYKLPSKDKEKKLIRESEVRFRGVSDWQNIGKSLGYWDFFKKKELKIQEEDFKKVLGEILKYIKETNNFRLAKVNHNKEWNMALEQCACKVDALEKEIISIIKDNNINI